MTIQAANRLDSIQEYYFSRKLEEIRQMDAAGANVLNLGVGSPDLPPSPKVIAALSAEAALDTAHAYQPYKGVLALREAIAKYSESTYGVQLNPEKEILPLLGSKEGIAHISMAFLNLGDEVLIPNPGYPTYIAATVLAGGKPVYYNLDKENDWIPDWNQLQQMKLDKVKLMWINYPNMPTGAKGSMELFEQIVAFGIRHNILICHDNPYSRILNDQPLSMLAVPGAKEIVLELNSLSKSHNMAGWRLGWVSGNPEHIRTVLRYKSNIDSGMFLPVQRGGIAALNEGADWFETLNAAYASRRSLVWKLLDDLGCSYRKEQSGLFVWARIPIDQPRSEEFCETLLKEARVFLAPGTVFGSNGEGYLRVSLCNKENVLKEAGLRIAKFVNDKA